MVGSLILLDNKHIFVNQLKMLKLPVDGSVVTRFVQFADWGNICGELLGAASKTIYEGRIEMAWIRKKSRSWLRIRLKSKENDILGRTSFRSSGES
ncbi:hypothetical protein J1N35_016754 [Gossypium stocksii]|uniref:Uncharacterized protein n=1 Tax=Gossypium stocksii TaxID=47602 RepID=A0A9D4A3E7_9ROSI|nr:hypothetical protein J1N35_016754 [Gossypium stocksii]